MMQAIMAMPSDASTALRDGSQQAGFSTGGSGDYYHGKIVVVTRWRSDGDPHSAHAHAHGGDNDHFVAKARHAQQAGARAVIIVDRHRSFAYSLPVHSFHTRRDRVASLTTCRLHGAAKKKSLTTRARPSPDLAVWPE